MFDNFQFSDVFQPEKEEKPNEVLIAVKKAGVMANKCLNNEDFKEYRVQFEIAQSKLIGAMITYTHEFFIDPKGGMDVYGAQIARFVTKIQDLRVLIGQVEADLRKAERVKQ